MIEVLVYERNDGSMAFIFEDGYVDYQTHDGRFDSEQAAKAALEAEGYEFIGVDNV